MSKFFEEDFKTRKEWKKEKKETTRKDRSKYKKTDLEKREKRHVEKAKNLDKQNLFKGRVLAILPEEIWVEREGIVHNCSLRGSLKKEVTRIKNLITVGDFVLFDPVDNVIVHVEERVSVLSRKEHLRQKQKQLLAANIDQVLIIASVMEPPLKPFLVDRYIIATCKGNMRPVIVINKIDLLPEKGAERELFETFVHIYKKLGIPIIPLSAITKEGIDLLKNEMKGKASVFSGQSGVGKSSLINEIAMTNFPVGEIVKKTKKGAHTTTSAYLIPLKFGGFCIDTPGIRSFGIWDLKKEDLDAYFPEIRDVGQECKFPNCSHTHEPKCAVKEEVEKENIPLLRYESYLKLFQEISS